MALSISEVLGHPAPEEVKHKIPTPSSKRKAADTDNDQDEWIPPDNPIRMMAESGTITIHHRILKSCIARAAGQRPAVVRDMATARLTVVAVRALVKKMKEGKPRLDITERTDLMILERKLRVSEAFQNGYFGLELKNAKLQGKHPFSGNWEEEKKNALVYYTKSHKKGEEFDYVNWKRFEMDLRADFENEKAEEASHAKVQAAYEDGQARREKRRKLASSPNEAGGEDAPMFEGCSSDFDADDIKPVASTAASKEPEPRYAEGHQTDTSVLKPLEDVAGCGHTRGEGEQKPSTPPDVHLDTNSHVATSNDRHHRKIQEFEEDSATPDDTSVRGNGRKKASKPVAPGTPRKRSPTDPRFAGIKKKKGDRRKTSPVRDIMESYITPPSACITSKHTTDVESYEKENQCQGMHPARAAMSGQQTPPSICCEKEEVRAEAHDHAADQDVLSPPVEDQWQGMDPDQAALLKQQMVPSKRREEVKDEVHDHAASPDEDVEFDRSVAEFEAMMEAEATAEYQANAAAAATCPTVSDLEPLCGNMPSVLGGTHDGERDSGDEFVSTPIVRDTPIGKDARNYDDADGGTHDPMDTIKTVSGLPGNNTDVRHAGESDESAKCTGSSAADAESTLNKQTTDQKPPPSPDDWDRAYFNLINRASKAWIRAIKQRIVDEPMEKGKPEEASKSIPPSVTLVNYHKDLRKPYNIMDRMEEAHRLSRSDPEAAIKMMEHPKLMPEPPSVGYEITAKFHVDGIYSKAKPLLRFRSRVARSVNPTRRLSDRKAYWAFRKRQAKLMSRKSFASRESGTGQSLHNDS